MKNNKIIVLTLGLTLILSSCADFSISKKRYSRGFNIDWLSSKDKAPEYANSAPKRDAEPKENVVGENSTENEISDTENPEIAAVELPDNTGGSVSISEISNPAEENSGTESKELKQVEKGKKSETKSLRKELKRNIKELKSSIKEKSLKNSIDESNETHDAVYTLLLIILAIIVPPLAIFLYFEAIEANFILNLILVVLGFYLWHGIGSLLLLAAVIHALLVVLGMLG